MSVDNPRCTAIIQMKASNPPIPVLCGTAAVEGTDPPRCTQHHVHEQLARDMKPMWPDGTRVES